MNHLQKAAPILASLNMDETIGFYTQKLRFKASWHDENYGIVHRDEIMLHFWKCNDNIFPENTGCYIYVKEVDALYNEFQQVNVIHPNGKLEDKPWGLREFSILDIHGNLIRLGENRNEIQV